MPVRTKRWDEPAEREDGSRILITRFRPRGLPKSQETWDQWQKDLAPSADLVKAYRHGHILNWSVYRAAYLKEMRQKTAEIEELAGRVRSGETITLLCSSSCLRESRCHRSLLKALIEERAKAL
jgi:uncharacterized protein YeaO (DUF488 family)